MKVLKFHIVQAINMIPLNKKLLLLFLMGSYFVMEFFLTNACICFLQILYVVDYEIF